MKETNWPGYPDDNELEAFIAEVENSSMIAPPVYLKERIMEEAVRSSNRNEAAKQARRKFLLYSIKITAAAAAAVVGLAVMPVDVSRGMAASENTALEKQIEKDVERYKKESEKMFREPEISLRISHVIGGVADWINKEGKKYD